MHACILRKNLFKNVAYSVVRSSQMSLESNKTLGGVGALLIAIGSFFPILSLVGIILVLIAMKGLAEYYDEEDIFQNALYGFIFGIIGIVAAIVIFFTAFFGPRGFGMMNWERPFTFPIVTMVLLITGLVVMFVFFLLQAIFYRKSFTILSEMSGEKIFDTAGLLLLIGAILTIIIVGLVLLLVAWILVTVGFFSIKTPTTQLPAAAPPPAPPAPVTVEKKFCQYCGTENKVDANFCKKCGKKLETD
jgi:uncharacterized membrane protein